MRILAIAITALAVGVTADASAATKQRLVARGDSTAVTGPCDAAGCPLTLIDGVARGTVSGRYTARFTLKVAEQFPNGEGGICAPLTGRIKVDHLTLVVSGVSCQDGGGPLVGSSFTGLATFRAKHGYRGGGVASFTEDAAHHHRMTLIGTLRR